MALMRSRKPRTRGTRHSTAQHTHRNAARAQQSRRQTRGLDARTAAPVLEGRDQAQHSTRTATLRGPSSPDSRDSHSAARQQAAAASVLTCGRTSATAGPANRRRHRLPGLPGRSGAPGSTACRRLLVVNGGGIKGSSFQDSGAA